MGSRFNIKLKNGAAVSTRRTKLKCTLSTRAAPFVVALCEQSGIRTTAISKYFKKHFEEFVRQKKQKEAGDVKEPISQRGEEVAGSELLNITRAPKLFSSTMRKITSELLHGSA